MQAGRKPQDSRAKFGLPPESVVARKLQDGHTEILQGRHRESEARQGDERGGREVPKERVQAVPIVQQVRKGNGQHFERASHRLAPESAAEGRVQERTQHDLHDGRERGFREGGGMSEEGAHAEENTDQRVPGRSGQYDSSVSGGHPSRPFAAERLFFRSAEVLQRSAARKRKT